MAMSGCAARSPDFAGPFLRALLFRAEGRGRQDRGGDLEGCPRPDAVQAAGRPGGHRHRQAHHLSGPSKYQIVIEALEPAGIGALMALMEERKRKLAPRACSTPRANGFARLPEVIGVVTSPTGAVIRDILHRLEDRFPRRVLVWPVRVQGEGSAEQVRPPSAASTRCRRAAGSAAGLPDRRARRRLAGGSVVVQRGDRGPRRRRQLDPADLGGRPRDPHHPDRFRRRQARPDADRRRGNGGPGTRRTVRRGRLVRAPGDGLRRQRGQESRRNELRAAARALPAAGELLAIPRQRLEPRRQRRPAPRAQGQYSRPPSPLRAGERRPDLAGAARPGQPTPHNG